MRIISPTLKFSLALALNTVLSCVTLELYTDWSLVRSEQYEKRFSSSDKPEKLYEWTKNTSGKNLNNEYLRTDKVLAKINHNKNGTRTRIYLNDQEAPEVPNPITAAALLLVSTIVLYRLPTMIVRDSLLFKVAIGGIIVAPLAASIAELAVCASAQYIKLSPNANDNNYWINKHFVSRLDDCKLNIFQATSLIAGATAAVTFVCL